MIQCIFDAQYWSIGGYSRLTRITGLLIARRSLKCGGDTERGHSARDNETPERSPKAKVRLGYDVRDDWIYKYIHVAQSLFLLGIISLQQCITIRSIFLQLDLVLLQLDLVLFSLPIVGNTNLRDSPLNIGNHSNVIL